MMRAVLEWFDTKAVKRLAAFEQQAKQHIEMQSAILGLVSGSVKVRLIAY